MRRNDHSFIIGVTGGVGSGKSTAAGMLSEILSCPVIDADKLSREVMDRPQVLERVRQAFGDGVFSGSVLDRKALGDIVFADAAKRSILNGIVHPAVREMFLELTEKYQDQDYIIYDCPLLIEADLQEDVDLTLLVYVDEETQIERVMLRDSVTREKALEKITAQMPLKDKKGLSDIVVYNDSDLEDLRERLVSAAAEIRRERG